MERARQELARVIPPRESRSFRARADRSNIPHTTLQHRARGRPPIAEKAVSQQYLSPWEEKALAEFVAHQDALGRPVRIKHLGSIAFSLARRREPAKRPSKPPGKNWSQSFYKRHKDLVASKAGALDRNCYNIYDKVTR